MSVHLLVRPPRLPSPSQRDLDTFDAVIAADPRVQVAGWRGLVPRAGFWATSALFKYGGIRGLQALPASRRATPRTYIAVLMGPQFSKCMPHFMLPATKAVYLFDVWPAVWDRVEAFLEHFGVAHAFVSARQSADHLRGRVSTQIHWLPEGLDPAPFRHRPMAERDIDVLQMGRRYNRYHDQIVEPLAARGAVYRYEVVRGQIIFPTHADLVDGLSRSKISVCVPSSITHPERSGTVETMTLRYLQSMASRCLIVGHAPAEMVDLFGYNPVVEIDLHDPAGQLVHLLGAIDRYEPLIERNYQALHSAHTWAHRWAAMSEAVLGVPPPR